MPIAFPIPQRGASVSSIFKGFQNQFVRVPAVNQAQIGTPFSSEKPTTFTEARSRHRNFRNLGKQFVQVGSMARPNPVNTPQTDQRLFKRVFAYGDGNRELRGVSRDSVGAILGNCRVMIFRTEDMSFVKETTSDASGAWAVSMMAGGPFFYVEYKAGAPDVAGTSKNTLVTAQGNG